MFDRSDENARMFNIRMLGRLLSLSLLFAAVSGAGAGAETKNVKIMMDWRSWPSLSASGPAV